MKALTVHIPDAVFDWLKSRARNRRLSEADVACETLQAAANGQLPSLGKLMSDLAGTGQGKHSDLSTNNKHLADLGQ